MEEIVVLSIIIAVALTILMLSGIYYAYQAIRLIERRVAVRV